MRTEYSQESQRVGIVAHYLAVFAFTMYIYAIIGRDVPGWVVIVGVVLLAALVFTFLYGFHRVGLWKFTWADTEQLDERELQLNRDSFRRAYNVLITIAVLAAALTLVIENSYFSKEAFLEKRSFNAVPLLLALAHIAKTLPATILAWTQDTDGAR